MMLLMMIYFNENKRCSHIKRKKKQLFFVYNLSCIMILEYICEKKFKKYYSYVAMMHAVKITPDKYIFFKNHKIKSGNIAHCYFISAVKLQIVPVFLAI